jgi:hypothetical protein
MVMAPSRGDFTVAPSPALVGSPTVGQPPIDPQLQQLTPFRLATAERSENIGQTTGITMTTAEQQIEVPVVGTGLVYGFDLQVQATTAANAATVVFTEDAPYSALSSIVYKDVNGELVNASGFHLKMAARYGGWEMVPHDVVGNWNGSKDVSVFSSTPGVGAGLGGSFNFHEKIPLCVSRRSLLPLLGNQDRAQSYTIRHNIGASSFVYSTPPTTLPSMVVTRMYENYAVPNPVNDNGVPNQVLPSHYGVLPFITQNVSDAQPQGSSTINHFIRRTGNVIRLLLLVLRSNGSRATAEANMPTSITLKVGNETLFTETTAYRRALMFDRYGIDSPAGVLAYDFLHDFAGVRSGGDFGNDWIWSQNLLQFQFLIAYPAGFGSTNNSLTIVTNDLIVPQGANVYGL